VVFGLGDNGGMFAEQIDDLAINAEGNMIASGHAIMNPTGSVKTIAAVVFRFNP
jgi:hypothetical protein